MINFWFWKRKITKVSKNTTEEFFKMSKRFQLKNRTMNAIKYETNWEVRLMNFMEKNENNQNLIVKIAGYRNYLMRNGCDREEAAREVLEYYQH